jgi:hypothetical protein
MSKMKWSWFLLLNVAALVFACTPKQWAIVQDVTHLVQDVCSEIDSVDDCLGKMQSKRLEMKAKDAGAE